MSGRGRIVPIGDSRVVQAPEPGTVRNIHVREGDVVTAGQLLIELDTTERLAEQTRLRETRISHQLDIQRIEHLLKAADSGLVPSVLQDLGAYGREGETLQRIRNRLASFTAKRESLLAQKAQQEASRAGHRSNIEHHEKVLPLYIERRKDMRELVRQGNVQKIQLIDAETKVLESENALRTSAAQIEQSLATSAEIASKLADLNAEFRAQLYDDLAGARLKLVEAEQQIVQITRKIELMSIVAPASGVLNRLSLNTNGAMVNAGQLLATIVPTDEEVEALINVSSRDMGFVSVGQEVTVKVDAFPYSRHGFIRTKVTRISQEAILGGELTSAEMLESGARQADPSDPFRRSYVARASLKRTELSSSGVKLPLTPGMTVVADIITGDRKVYEYLFTSLVERVHEFARER